MTDGPRVGVIGGTFDPIHAGHLAAADAAARALMLSEVRFMPSRVPPHRAEGTVASEYHRFAMVALAIIDDSRWRASDLELRRHGPSFTYDTLMAMHAEGLSPSQIFFITGADAFADISTWFRFPALLDAAHFVVVARPGADLEALKARLPALRSRMIGPGDLGLAELPRIILVDAATPDVSSTEIRRLARAGLSVRDLVPARVAVHIERHGLYGPRQPEPRRTNLPLEGSLHGEDRTTADRS
jgi:nicotinate-nucleotide adenylyltransferase